MSILDKNDFDDRKKYVAPRYKVELKASVIITVVSYCEARTESYFIMHGRLLNISRSGLALIISNKNMQELSRLNGDLLFRLLLPLPVKAIELEATPVRYQKLESDQISEILVGARITNMNDHERDIFTKFINQFENPRSVNAEIREAVVKESIFDPNEIIGMDIFTAFVQAKRHCYSIRAIRKNGNECLVQRDYFPNRVNVATQENVIIEILGIN